MPEEEKKKPEGEEETPSEKKKSKLEEMKEAAKELKEAAKMMDTANAKREELMENEAAVKAMGGESDSGQIPPKPKEQTAIEYKDAVERGEIGRE